MEIDILTLRPYLREAVQFAQAQFPSRSKMIVPIANCLWKIEVKIEREQNVTFAYVSMLDEKNETVECSIFAS
jgi:hypothetical protein